MPQIEIPFTVGQRVLWQSVEAIIDRVTISEGGHTFEVVVPSDENQRHWVHASKLTLTESVIEWERDDTWGLWRGGEWYAYDDGRLLFGSIAPHRVGHFDDPRAVAEATQKLWNEMRTKGDTDD